MIFLVPGILGSLLKSHIISSKFITEVYQMLVEGIEPPLLKEPDFKSSAATISPYQLISLPRIALGSRV
tara:strand:- start:237 stop:443 length:207 start_codon:yes stop_codon:yes gene_type:complete